ncbi:MAG: hypothetical protein WC497_02150 [Patescibacteria group bacterium]
MSNRITEKYFTHTGFSDAAKTLKEIVAATGFRPGQEIFRGQIYDKNKVGSLIYRGQWRNKPAVLKIQGLCPEIDEIDIIKRFNRQNKSTKVRLPRLYGGKKWNKINGYGYLLLEYIDAPKIYRPPFADTRQMRDFRALYQEYKSRCLNTPLFAQEPDERQSLRFVMKRLKHWLAVAQSKGRVNKTTKAMVRKFQALARRHLPGVRMKFMHGHFTYDDIYKLSANEYVLMSNLFWSYRPEYYDAAFHLWAGIKSIRKQHITVNYVISYLEKWIAEYKKLPIVRKDAGFERKFYLMMAERCVAALLVDLRNQYYASNRQKHITHLVKLFSGIFDYCGEQLNKNK